MKIKYSVWSSEHECYNAEREVPGWDSAGIIRAFDDALDLRQLRHEDAIREARNRESERRLEILSAPPVPEPARDDGPHARVYEYDGAFHCLDCTAEWGALPGKPEMPLACEPPKPKPTMKDLLSLVEFGHWGGTRIAGLVDGRTDLPEVHGYKKEYEERCPVCAKIGALR